MKTTAILPDLNLILPSSVQNMMTRVISTVLFYFIRPPLVVGVLGEHTPGTFDTPVGPRTRNIVITRVGHVASPHRQESSPLF